MNVFNRRGAKTRSRQARARCRLSFFFSLSISNIFTVSNSVSWSISPASAAARCTIPARYYYKVAATFCYIFTRTVQEEALLARFTQAADPPTAWMAAQMQISSLNPKHAAWRFGVAHSIISAAQNLHDYFAYDSRSMNVCMQLIKRLLQDWPRATNSLSRSSQHGPLISRFSNLYYRLRTDQE